jgi:hypothetical protein
MIKLMIKPNCRTLASRSLEAFAQGNSNFGQAKQARNKGEDAKAGSLTAKGSDHHRDAAIIWDRGQEAAKSASKEDCTKCLGKLGVEICPLLSEARVSVGDLYSSLGKKRLRVQQALKGKIATKSPNDPEIAKTIGILTSDIDENHYKEYQDPNYEPKSRCTFKQDPEILKNLAQDLARGADPRVLAYDIGIGKETPSELSNGRLTSDEPIATYLRPESILGRTS